MIKNNLSKILGEKRMKQQELAKLTGLTFSTITLIYHDKHKSISYSVLSKICEALNIGVGELFEYVKVK